MSADTIFKAPWGPLLTAITLIAGLILLGVMLLGVLTGPQGNIPWLLTMVGLPLVILVVTACFSVRGYRLAGHTLYIQRLGWASPVELQSLVTAEVDPEAMAESLRTWGNGGLFSFTGNYRNRKLGPYRAYATDLSHAVILKFPQRTLVITPEDPAAFVKAVLAHRNI